MDKETVNEIIACLPEGKTRFDYFKDRYALLLLSQVVTQGKKVAELKRTPYARLLERPLVKQLLASTGQGWLTPDLFDMVWQNPSYTFLLTLTTWGGQDYSWQQTSRPGYNLVLQLNFSNQHEQPYRQLTRPTSIGALNKYYGHPVMRKRPQRIFRETLAWARIDLDFEDDQALIEEIQSDWVREAQEHLREVLCCEDDPTKEVFIDGFEGRTENLKRYFSEVLKPYTLIWAETMLAATIQFIREELGLHRIFYHSYETGCVIKHCEQPRSLYTELPRKFCFQKTEQAPAFLQRNKIFRKTLKKSQQPFWYQIEI